MKNQKLEYFNVIIATNQYAGNFVHDMGVFITGKAGDVSVDDVAQLTFESDSRRSIDSKILSELKKNTLVCDGEDSEYEGCESVCEMVQVESASGRHEYLAVAIHFTKMPSAKMLEYLKTRANEYAVHRATVNDRMGRTHAGLEILYVSVEKVVREWRYVIEKTMVPA